MKHLFNHDFILGNEGGIQGIQDGSASSTTKMKSGEERDDTATTSSKRGTEEAASSDGSEQHNGSDHGHKSRQKALPSVSARSDPAPNSNVEEFVSDPSASVSQPESTTTDTTAPAQTKTSEDNTEQSNEGAKGSMPEVLDSPPSEDPASTMHGAPHAGANKELNKPEATGAGDPVIATSSTPVAPREDVPSTPSTSEVAPHGDAPNPGDTPNLEDSSAPKMEQSGEDAPKALNGSKLPRDPSFSGAGPPKSEVPSEEGSNRPSKPGEPHAEASGAPISGKPEIADGDIPETPINQEAPNEEGSPKHEVPPRGIPHSPHKSEASGTPRSAKDGVAQKDGPKTPSKSEDPHTEAPHIGEPNTQADGPHTDTLDTPIAATPDVPSEEAPNTPGKPEDPHPDETSNTPSSSETEMPHGELAKTTDAQSDAPARKAGANTEKSANDSPAAAQSIPDSTKNAKNKESQGTSVKTEAGHGTSDEQSTPGELSRGTEKVTDEHRTELQRMPHSAKDVKNAKSQGKSNKPETGRGTFAEGPPPEDLPRDTEKTTDEPDAAAPNIPDSEKDIKNAKSQATSNKPESSHDTFSEGTAPEMAGETKKVTDERRPSAPAIPDSGKDDINAHSQEVSRKPETGHDTFIEDPTQKELLRDTKKGADEPHAAAPNLPDSVKDTKGAKSQGISKKPETRHGAFMEGPTAKQLPGDMDKATDMPHAGASNVPDASKDAKNDKSQGKSNKAESAHGAFADGPSQGELSKDTAVLDGLEPKSTVEEAQGPENPVPPISDREKGSKEPEIAAPSNPEVHPNVDTEKVVEGNEKHPTNPVEHVATHTTSPHDELGQKDGGGQPDESEAKEQDEGTSETAQKTKEGECPRAHQVKK